MGYNERFGFGIIVVFVPEQKCY